MYDRVLPQNTSNSWHPFWVVTHGTIYRQLLLNIGNIISTFCSLRVLWIIKYFSYLRTHLRGFILSKSGISTLGREISWLELVWCIGSIGPGRLRLVRVATRLVRVKQVWVGSNWFKLNRFGSDCFGLGWFRLDRLSLDL